MNIEDATLPEGVDPDDVEFDDEWPEAVAYDTGVEFYPQDGRFNPQNGRWYRNEDGYDVFRYNRVSTRVGHEVHCAYRDCDGRDTVETEMEIPESYKCSSCGAARMGRAQFTRESQRRYNDRQHIASRTRELRDEFAREMKRLTDAGVGPAAAMDYLMCSVGDTRASEWAEARGVETRSVKANMKRVANALGETVRWTK